MTDPKTVAVQERLRALLPIGSITGNSDFGLVNPDGPEAADLLDRCRTALEAVLADDGGYMVGRLSEATTKQVREVLTQLNGGRNVGA